MPGNHVHVRTSVKRRYVIFFKIAYHLSCHVRRAANEMQNVLNILTKVSDEVCWSGRTLYKVCKETFNPHFHRTAESQIKKRKIPKIKRKKGTGVKLVENDSSNVRGEKCAQIATTIRQNLIAFAANISTRVIAQKLEREQEKKWARDRVTRSLSVQFSRQTRLIMPVIKERLGAI